VAGVYYSESERYYHLLSRMVYGLSLEVYLEQDQEANVAGQSTAYIWGQ
jgi:hypothetical protein